MWRECLTVNYSSNFTLAARVRQPKTGFAALVQRHGSMVFHVCRGIVGNDHDAQDAFQATFLIPSAEGEHSVGTRLDRTLASSSCPPRRRPPAEHPPIASEQLSVVRPRFAAPHGELQWPDDWTQMLHEEVDRLPGCFRLPIVLCDLEGQSYEVAARSLGCPIGTVKSRPVPGRDRLRSRLTRRGLSFTSEASGIAIPAALIPDTISSVLSKATIQGVMQAKTNSAASLLGAGLQ